jgi:hypothetical protein
MPKLADFKDNINQSAITSDMMIIKTGAINGWTVGAPVAATGPNNMAITYSNAQKINLGNSKFVELKNAVRLLVKDGGNYGNIWHTFNARSGHKHIFTWYDLADYISGDTKAYNVGYDVHISVNDPVHSSTALVKGAYNSQWGGWRKQRIEYTHSGPDQTLYISFQCKNVDGRNQGALVTLINGYLDREDDSDTTDVSNFRLIGPNPSQLVLDKSHGTTKQLGNAAWKFSLEQTSDDGQSWHIPDNDQSIRFNLKDGVITSGTDATFWRHTQSKDDSHIMLPQGALHAEIPASDNNSKMIAGLVLSENFHPIKNVGYNSNGHFTSYNQSPDGAIPLVLKSAAGPDIWTITGTIPAPLTTPQTVTFTLLKNSKASGTKENVSIRLDTNDYLTVDPAASITTEADGTFKLTLTPAAGQTTAHNTALTLTHDGQDTKFTVTTGGAPAAKYDIKVYKDSDGKNPIDLNTVNTWTANTGHYVYVSVVKHGTSERVDTASINIAASPTTALVPLTSPVKIENGTLARVAFKPGTSASGNATITFSTTIDGQECLAELKVYLGESGSLEVVTPTPITLSPGIERTPSGDLAILDVRFNPQVSGAVPEISFRVDGDDLTVLSEENIFVTDGVLKPADPKGNGDYRILPVLKTDKNASGPAKITFFIDKVKYPQEAAKWKQVTVTVNISSVDHVKWSVASGALVDTGSNPTVLKTGLKAYDANGKEMSSYVMDVHIVTDDVDATFVDNTLTHRLTGPDSTGWARLPEMIVGQKTGKIHLQALLPGGGGYLKEELLLNVTAAQRPKDIVIHPNGVYPISWDDLDSGKFTHDSSRYAQLNDAGGHAIHSGKVTFTIAANTANARMATPDEVSTPTIKTVDVNANGRAFWPDIIIGNTTGAFTLTASNPDVIAAQTVKITVS